MEDLAVHITFFALNFFLTIFVVATALVMRSSKG